MASVNVDSAFELYHLDIGEVRNELSHILSDDTVGKLEERRTQLRNELQKLRDPDTDEAPEEGDENYEEYKKYQNELKEVVNQLNLPLRILILIFLQAKSMQLFHLLLMIRIY